MKKHLLITILFTLFSISITAQTSCPTVSVIGPSQQIEISGSMTFTAKVEGISLENLKFKWDVSSGTITSGQGTSVIIVATTDDMAGMTITATVEVSGFSQNCSNYASGIGEIEEKIPFGSPLKFDDYNKISWSKEKLILDRVANGLEEDENMIAIFRITIAAKNSTQIFKVKSKRIEKYLMEKHKIPKGRIKVVLSGNEENRTEIYLIPIGVTPPF